MRVKRQPTVLIGTSGWHYAHWRGPFYPAGLPAPKFLDYYASRFRTAEINTTFYHLPLGTTLAAWRESVAPDFIFAVKASRYITHMKKLKDTGGAVSRFMKLMDNLGKTLGPVLFQLPPRWKVNPGRLQEFLEILPRGPRYSFEFRDPSWFAPEIYSLLRRHGVSFCIYELQGDVSPKEVTADYIYIRLHGPGAAYQGSYPMEILNGWAGSISTWSGQGKDVYCYFNNDQGGYAVENALQLRRMLAGERHGSVSGGDIAEEAGVSEASPATTLETRSRNKGG
jgi:uncharacterized protein YecE (DUF72 family)